MNLNACPRSTASCTIQCLGQGMTKGFSGRLSALLRDRLGCAPHKSPSVRFWEGQNRQWAFRRKELERLAGAPPAQASFGQQCGLAEISNVGLWSWIAIGMNHQNPGLGLKFDICFANDPSHTAPNQRCLETLDQRTVPDHVAQTGAS
jgi:hypothetical protein